MDLTTLAVALLVTGLVALLVLRMRGGGARRAHEKSRSRKAEAADTVLAWLPELTRVFTATEQRAYKLLTAALPDHIVLAQVQLARFISVPTRNSYHEWLRRVGQLSADFLVCDEHSVVVAVVDVRRPAGQDPERTRERHARMDRVLKKAGVRVVVWHEDQLPHANTVRDMVLAGAGSGAKRNAPEKAATRPASIPGTAAAKAALARELDAADEQLEEFMNMRDPVPSTMFDDFDTTPAPLSAAPQRRAPGTAR